MRSSLVPYTLDWKRMYRKTQAYWNSSLLELKLSFWNVYLLIRKTQSGVFDLCPIKKSQKEGDLGVGGRGSQHATFAATQFQGIHCP